MGGSLFLRVLHHEVTNVVLTCRVFSDDGYGATAFHNQYFERIGIMFKVTSYAFCKQTRIVFRGHIKKDAVCLVNGIKQL